MWDLGSRQVIRTFTTNKGPVTYATIVAKPFSEDMNIDDKQTDKVCGQGGLHGVLQDVAQHLTLVLLRLDRRHKRYSRSRPSCTATSSQVHSPVDCWSNSFRESLE
jgi:hypothetical protein